MTDPNTLFDRDDTSIPEVPHSKYTPRVAIVTGGAQGIGYSIAHRLADDGIDVAVNDVPSKKDQIDAVVEELRKKGRHALSVPGDMRSEIDIVSMIEKTVLELGSVDIVSSPSLKCDMATYSWEDDRECGHRRCLRIY